MAKIGVVGYGIVGEATEYSFKKRNPNHEFIIHDKYKKGYSSLEQVARESDFTFICLPTPFNEKEKRIDLSIINKNIEKIVKYRPNKESVIVIKSTVVPGTTRQYSKKYLHVRFAFNPEFLEEADYLENALNPDRIIVGADNDKTSLKLTDLYRLDFPEVSIYRTDTITAEMVKYTANCFLATKVIFANEMYDICQKLGINYDEVREMVMADKRIGKTHLNVTSVRGFGGKCFPKDIQAMIGFAKDKGVDVELLKTVWQKNLRIRKIHDWEDIPGTTSENTKNFEQ